jgi:prepilin-type N-terminal cleavage/methylation domain-containing protein
MIIRNKESQNHARRGFTLIELLIVIVIIGILAVAVLSAINPIEQRNKATDTGRRSDAAELLNAIERYYATNGSYPWEDVSGASVPAGALMTTVPTWLSDTVPDASSLVGSSELKAQFADRESLQDMAVNLEDGLVVICYQVDSTAFSKETALLRNVDGSDYTAGGTAYRCVPE